MHPVLTIILAVCVAANVPGMMEGYWYSWASGVFCALLFVAHLALITRS